MTQLLNLQFIETERVIGGSTEGNPSRIVRQLFTPDGQLVLEYDPYEEKTLMIANLLKHLNWI